MSFGIKISKDGYDAKTCNDENLVFSSEWSTYRIRDRIIFSMEHNEETKEYVHGYGFIPFVWAYCGFVTGEYIPDGYYYWDTSFNEVYFSTSINDNSVNVSVYDEIIGGRKTIVLLLMEKLS
jgi:hypothetical protein